MCANICDKMGILSQLLVAHASEAAEAAATDEPSEKWDGFTCRGLDRIKLATLWALVESGSVQHHLDERLEKVTTIDASQHGPWVDIIPTKMLSAPASIAVMDDDEQASIAEQWSRTDEFEGWDSAEVFDLLRCIGDTAETTEIEGKTLLIWTSL